MPSLDDLCRGNLDFHNVTLVPKTISTIPSRAHIDTSTEFCGVKLNVPIVAAPMKDVCDGKTARLINDLGGFAFLHRFCTIEEQVEEFKKSEKTAGCAVGITGDWWNRLSELRKAGCDIFCIDVANGASTMVMEAIEKIRSMSYSDPPRLVAGNVCSREGYEFLEYHCSAIRVGVAGGAGCTTRNATGIYAPMLSLIYDCYSSLGFISKEESNKIIADGGIKEPQDFCKALIFGANTVMIGSQIAACKDSPAKFDENDWNGYDKDCQVKIYRGSASFENQQLYKETPRYIEGTTRYLECFETIEQMFNRYHEGLKSSMSYFNARTLNEYRENINYVVL